MSRPIDRWMPAEYECTRGVLRWSGKMLTLSPVAAEIG
jgi:hypothetical protein